MPPTGGPLGVGSAVGDADWLGLSAGASDALGALDSVVGTLAEGAVEVVC